MPQGPWSHESIRIPIDWLRLKPPLNLITNCHSSEAWTILIVISVTTKKLPNVYKSCAKMISLKNERFWKVAQSGQTGLQVRTVWPNDGIISGLFFSKVTQKVATLGFLTFLVMFFKIAQNVPKYMGYFRKKYWLIHVSKKGQSGHTEFEYQSHLRKYKWAMFVTQLLKLQQVNVI